MCKSHCKKGGKSDFKLCCKSDMGVEPGGMWDWVEGAGAGGGFSPRARLIHSDSQLIKRQLTMSVACLVQKVSPVLAAHLTSAFCTSWYAMTKPSLQRDPGVDSTLQPAVCLLCFELFLQDKTTTLSRAPYFRVTSVWSPKAPFKFPGCNYFKLGVK